MRNLNTNTVAANTSSCQGTVIANSLFGDTVLSDLRYLLGDLGDYAFGAFASANGAFASANGAFASVISALTKRWHLVPSVVQLRATDAGQGQAMRPERMPAKFR